MEKKTKKDEKGGIAAAKPQLTKKTNDGEKRRGKRRRTRARQTAKRTEKGGMLKDDEGFHIVLKDAGILVLRIGNEDDDLSAVFEFWAEAHPFVVGDVEIEETNGGAPLFEQLLF